MQTALSAIPQSMTIDIRALVEEYAMQETPEARFIKAIDKIEPVFELFDKYGKQIVHTNKTTYEQMNNEKSPYITDYPVITQFISVMMEIMVEQGYFNHDNG